MKIRLRNNQDVRDVSPDVADMMVSAGLADKLTPQEANDYAVQKGSPLPFHDLTWSTREGEFVDAYQYAPALVWRCSTCAQITFAHPMDKPAEQTTFHFQKQHCPDDVYAAYLRLFDAWSKKGARKLKGSYERALDNVKKQEDERLALLRRGIPVTI